MLNDDEVDISQGKQLFWGTAANDITNLVEGTTTITPPERELGTADYTNDGSPGRTKQYKPGMFEPGTAKASYIYNKTGFATIEEQFQSRATLYWKLVTPDAADRVWKGFMTKHNEGEKSDDNDVPTVDIEMQVTGIVDYSASGS